MSDYQRRWARCGLALAAALAAVALAAEPAGSGAIPDRPPAGGHPPAGPSSAKGAADLALVWVDVTDVVRPAFPRAAREIASLLERMGVRATVRHGDPRGVSSGSELTVVILPQRTPGTGLDRNVMGATHRTPLGAPAIWVYAEGVGATLGLDLMHYHHLSPAQWRDFGTALGRVVVHEVVHALSPTSPHLNGGLMASRMGRPLLGSSRLLIDAGTAEALRRALAGHAAAEETIASTPSAADDDAEARP